MDSTCWSGRSRIGIGSDLQALADQVAPTLIAPLKRKQDAIHAVRSREVDGLVEEAKVVRVIRSGERAAADSV